MSNMGNMDVNPVLITNARVAAQNQDLDPALVMGICEVESSWNSLANRFEPGWYNRPDWDVILRQTPSFPKTSSIRTEIATRSMSWGLMQCLGQTTRELGFSDWLSALNGPVTGLYWGCKILHMKLVKSGLVVNQALLLYNGGADAAYPDRVLKARQNYVGLGGV